MFEYPPVEAAAQQAERRRFSLMDAPATYLLLAINIAVFLIMAVSGPVPALWHAHQYQGIATAQFSFDELVQFGGSQAGAVVEYHQWWRLITATFVHANFLHLAINMWCLWNLGLLGEPLLGRQGMIATYLLTGVAGNLLSLAYAVFMRQDALVVGASGAVFGIAGILIVLLSNRKLAVPWDELRGLRRSVIQFAVLNLVLGIAPQFVLPMAPLRNLPVDLSSLTHIDNSAHIGGFFGGLALGWPLFPRMMSGRQGYRARQKVVFLVAAFLLVLVAYGTTVAGR